MTTLGAPGGGIGVAVGGGRGVAVAGGRGVQVGVGAGGRGVAVGAAANARAAAPVGVNPGGLGVNVGVAVNAGASAAVGVGVDSVVLVSVGARVGVELAGGGDGLGMLEATSRAGAACAGSVGLLTSVAAGRASVGGAAVQAARRATASSRGTGVASSDRRFTSISLRPTVGGVNSQVGRPRLTAVMSEANGMRAGQLLAGGWAADWGGHGSRSAGGMAGDAGGEAGVRVGIVVLGVSHRSREA